MTVSGTLTENELVFRKWSIEGVKYAAGNGHLVGESSETAVDLSNQNVRSFLGLGFLCNLRFFV